MPARKENSISGFVRRAYEGLMEENFEQYHNIVSKLRSRAKARGFDPSNLSQEQFDLINNDALPELEKGERIHLSWENSSMCKGMLEDAIRYLTDNNDYWNKIVMNGVDGDIRNYLYIPSTVKMAARGLKWGNNYLLTASHLSPQQIDLVKDKLQMEDTNYSNTKEVKEIL